jgi:general secretion pathway protein J
VLQPKKVRKRPLLKNYGFTLLELLISIVILAILILIVMGGLRLSYRSVEAGEKKMEALERVRASLTLMDAQIQSQIPLSYDEDGERKYYFKGERTFVELASNYSLWQGEKGYVVVSYTVTVDPQGKRVLTASEYTPGRSDKKETRLLNPMDDVYFEYFYRDPMEEEGTWVENWTEENLIPEKIRIHFVSGRKELSLILPLRTAGDLAPKPTPQAGATPVKKP